MHSPGSSSNSESSTESPEKEKKKTSNIIFGVHLLFMFFGGYSLWTYRTWKHFLGFPDLDPRLVKSAKRMEYLHSRLRKTEMRHLY